MKQQIATTGPPRADVWAAWQHELSSQRDAKLATDLRQREPALYPRFSDYYQRLHALPRRWRRGIGRRLRQSLAVAGAFLTVTCSGTAFAETYGGVEFPAGASSFVDGPFVYEPEFGGTGRGVPLPIWQVVENTLGPPDTSFVALGHGGRLSLRFLDNSLRGSGDDSPDLWVFEIGSNFPNSASEATFVELSRDGRNWYSVGSAPGATSGVDIDAFGFGPDQHFAFVRLTDDADILQRNNPGPVGADIDAVGASSSGAPFGAINEYVNLVPDRRSFAFDGDTTGCSIVGYELSVWGHAAPGFKNQPELILTNKSSEATVTSFSFTVGDTQRNFDGAGIESSQGGFTSQLQEPDGNFEGGERSDNLRYSFSGSFDAGDYLRIATDIDIDNADSFEDFETIFFNNGTLPNSVVTVGFSNGAELSMTLPETPEPLAGWPASYSFSQQEALPSSEFVGMFGFLAKLTNFSASPVFGPFVSIHTLTNENMVAADWGRARVGDLVEIAREAALEDGVLSPGESVDVPFRICVTNRRPFQFFVDVYGVVD